MADTENTTCAFEGTFSPRGVAGSNEINFHTGLITVAAGLWVFGAFITTKVTSIPRYRNLGSYMLVVALRRLPSIVDVIPFVNMVYSWQDFTFIECDFFGFWETFFAVFELESFTMVCLERYVQAKYVSNGWTIPSSHYYLYGSLSTFFAFMYAYSPIIGIGRYAKDFNCYHCTYDMILPEVGWKRLLVLIVFFMRSIKPAMIMVIHIYWARKLELNLRRYRSQRKFTKGVTVALCVNLACALPITLIRGTVVLSQLIYDKPVVPSAYVIAPAIGVHWVAPLLALVALTHHDDFLHKIVQKFVDTFDFLNVDDEPETSHDEEDDSDDNDNDNDKRG